MHPGQKRHWDQFFISGEYAEKEASLAALSPSDIVLEIGAGSGILTSRIARHCKVIAVEPDMEFAEQLRRLRNPNIEVVEASFAVLPSIHYNKVVSNPPYSLSQPVLVAVLSRPFDIAVFCFQREFVRKMRSATKLGYVVRQFCDILHVEKVPASAFTPRAVASSIVVLRQKKPLDPEYWSFLSRLWRSRNRNVVNLVKNPGEFGKRKLSSLSPFELYELWKINAGQ